MATPDIQQLGNAALGNLVLGGPPPATDGSLALTGTVEQPNDLTGVLDVHLAGTVDQTNDATGTLTVVGDVALTGSVDQTNDATGTLTVENPSNDLVGSVNQPNDLAGTLDVLSPVALVGTVAQPQHILAIRDVYLAGLINQLNDVLGGIVGLPPAPTPPPAGMTEGRIRRVSILMEA